MSTEKPRGEALLPWMSVAGLVAVLFGVLWFSTVPLAGAVAVLAGVVLFVGGLIRRQNQRAADQA